jgi:hypothetical protein
LTSEAPPLPAGNTVLRFNSKDAQNTLGIAAKLALNRVQLKNKPLAARSVMGSGFRAAPSPPQLPKALKYNPEGN